MVDATAGPDSSRPDAASLDSVLCIYELCEHILELLSMQDLLLAQRISTTVREVIKSSPVLQSRLFLKAEKFEHEDGWKINKDGYFTVCDEEKGKERVTSLRFDFNGPRRMKVFIYNPLLLAGYNKNYSCTLSPGSDDRVQEQGLRTLQPADEELFEKAFADASCRSMFLTQPPVTHVQLEIRSPDDSRQFSWSAGLHIKEATGIRFGQLADAVAQYETSVGRCCLKVMICEGTTVDIGMRQFVEDVKTKHKG